MAHFQRAAVVSSGDLRVQHVRLESNMMYYLMGIIENKTSFSWISADLTYQSERYRILRLVIGTYYIAVLVKVSRTSVDMASINMHSSRTSNLRWKSRFEIDLLLELWVCLSIPCTRFTKMAWKYWFSTGLKSL